MVAFADGTETNETAMLREAAGVEVSAVPRRDHGELCPASATSFQLRPIRLNHWPFSRVLIPSFRMTIFQKIINREIPADIVFEDDDSLAFRDVNPQAPVHVLLIPKKPIRSLDDLTASDAELCGQLLLNVPKVAQQLGLSGGYRTVINTGGHGGQTVFHLHIHILGGRGLTWPPG